MKPGRLILCVLTIASFVTFAREQWTVEKAKEWEKQTPWLVGWMLRKSNSIRWQIASFVSGQLLILVLGVAHLTLFYTHDLSKALMVGAVPFLVGDVFKIVAAVSIHRSSQALVRHYRG